MFLNLLTSFGEGSMNEGKIKWCLKQDKGIAIIESKSHLAESYMKEADETLENVFSTKGKWKLITAYYACYNAVYALFMKTGIKCEIHDCTLELMELFGFEPSEIGYLKKLKEDRIQVQYYLKEIALKDEDSVKRFVSKCKILLDGLNSENVETIRKKIENLRYVI